MPEDDDSDPNIYVEETVTILLPTANPDAHEVTDDTQALDYEEWKKEAGIELDVQYLNSLRNGRVGDDALLGELEDEEGEEDSDESYVSEESANKMAMAMML